MEGRPEGRGGAPWVWGMGMGMQSLGCTDTGHICRLCSDWLRAGSQAVCGEQEGVPVQSRRAKALFYVVAGQQQDWA